MTTLNCSPMELRELINAFNIAFPGVVTDRLQPWDDPFLAHTRDAFAEGYLAAKRAFQNEAPRTYNENVETFFEPVDMAGMHYEYVQFGEPNEAGDVGLMPVLVPDGFTVVRVPEETPE